MTPQTKLRRAKARWESARHNVALERTDLNAQIREIVEAGEMSQSQVATALGWPRQRVSKLLHG